MTRPPFPKRWASRSKKPTRKQIAAREALAEQRRQIALWTPPDEGDAA